MTHDIKATVEELERLSHKAEPPSWSDRCSKFPPDPAFLDYMPPKDREFVVKLRNALPSLLAELRRLWAIEEAAVRYRDKFDGSCKGYCSVMDELSTRDALFAALPPRKEDT